MMALRYQVQDEKTGESIGVNYVSLHVAEMKAHQLAIIKGKDYKVEDVLVEVDG